MLKFSKANSKLAKLYSVKALRRWLKNKRRIYSLDLLSGHSCPFARECYSKAVKHESGKLSIVDGPDTLWRCYSASQEALFPDTFKLREHNFNALKYLVTESEMIELISASLPKNAGIVRIHSAGEFFVRRYFRAWLAVASANPDRLFYAYTKAVRYWIQDRESIPANFVLTASRGGKDDALIDSHNLRSVRVILHPSEANGLEIDSDDRHAAIPEWRDRDFALVIHGVQPKGSESAAALQRLKREGLTK